MRKRRLWQRVHELMRQRPTRMKRRHVPRRLSFACAKSVLSNSWHETPRTSLVPVDGSEGRVRMPKATDSEQFIERKGVVGSC